MGSLFRTHTGKRMAFCLSEIRDRWFVFFSREIKSGQGESKIFFWNILEWVFFVMTISLLAWPMHQIPLGVHIVSFNSSWLTDLLLWSQFNLERRLTDWDIHWMRNRDFFCLSNFHFYWDTGGCGVYNGSKFVPPCDEKRSEKNWIKNQTAEFEYLPDTDQSMLLT